MIDYNQRTKDFHIVRSAGMVYERQVLIQAIKRVAKIQNVKPVVIIRKYIKPRWRSHFGI